MKLKSHHKGRPEWGGRGRVFCLEVSFFGVTGKLSGKEIANCGEGNGRVPLIRHG